jgi:6-phosphofructokinase 1
MPAGFIRRDGHGITAAARGYLEPLIRGEAYPPYGRNGLPDYRVPQGRSVAPRLPAFEG